MIEPRAEFEAEQMLKWAEEQIGQIASRITNNTATQEDLNELERLIKLWKEQNAIHASVAT